MKLWNNTKECVVDFLKIATDEEFDMINATFDERNQGKERTLVDVVVDILRDPNAYGIEFEVYND